MLRSDTDLSPPLEASRYLRRDASQVVCLPLARAIGIFGALGCAAAFTSVSQVWLYPYPRALILFLGIFSFLLALIGFGVAMLLHIERGAIIANGPLIMSKRNVYTTRVSIAALIAAVIPFHLIMSTGFGLTNCADPLSKQWDLCNASAEKFDEEMRKHLKVEIRKTIAWPVSGWQR